MIYKKGDFITKMMDTNFPKISGTWKNLIFGIHEPALLYIQKQVECKDHWLGAYRTNALYSGHIFVRFNDLEDVFTWIVLSFYCLDLNH